MKPYLQYAQDVASGKQTTGDYIKLAVERFYRLLDDDRYEFREEAVDIVVQFFSLLKHSTGRHAGTPFILEPWQHFAIANIYGFYIRDSGERLTQNAYIEMARKQGKSAFGVGMCLYSLIADGEQGAEVYLAANSRDQVKLSSWPLCSNFAKGLDPQGKRLEVYRDMVKLDLTKSWLKVLASDSTKLDGPNASMYLLDEYHAARNTGMKDVLQSSQGMRENPLGVIITTAGFDKLGVCYEYREMCVDILKELKEDDSIFIAIYSMDEGDDWQDDKLWIKSNPNLGVTVQKRYIEGQIRKAINSTSEEVGVKTKTLNMWVDSSDVWIPDSYLLDNSIDMNLKDYEGMEAFAGIDLASTSDLTCVNFMIPMDNGEFHFKTYYYLPEAALTEKRFKDQYGEWRRQGLLKITPGNVTDYDYILNDLVEANKTLFLLNIAYDPYNATQFVLNAQDRGLPMEAYGQNLGNFNRPTKEMERLILSGRAKIDNNVINRHCFRNVTMARDNNGNVKPSKKYEEKKIDGVIAMLESLGIYLQTPRYSGTLY